MLNSCPTFLAFSGRQTLLRHKGWKLRTVSALTGVDVDGDEWPVRHSWDVRVKSGSGLRYGKNQE